eukprot:GHVH01006692.1.p1 GENE.GHVH01006692.1~~GHVH01006692.1.p1  ORF type:complete len:231 (-),score=39.22 GHVH01006692.1:342-1034(-)
MSEAMPAPSRMNLQIYKQKKKAAETGHSLLKKKSDALTGKFRAMLKDIVECKRIMGEELNDAGYAMAKATYATPMNFSKQIIENVKKPALTVSISGENIAGVVMPKFTMKLDHSVDVLGSIGVASGAQVIRDAGERYRKALLALVRLASLQTAFFTLDQQIKMTNRRVNALENVVIPKLINGTSYIVKELDEMEREEFFRLKKITEKKKAAAAIEDARLAAELMQKQLVQ